MYKEKERSKEKRDFAKDGVAKVREMDEEREYEWENREGAFFKRRLIKDLPKMPLTLRVPLWLLF